MSSSTSFHTASTVPAINNPHLEKVIERAINKAKAHQASTLNNEKRQQRYLEHNAQLKAVSQAALEAMWLKVATMSTNIPNVQEKEKMISVVNQETRLYLQKMDEAIAEFVNHSLEKHQQASTVPYTEAHTIINSLDKVRYKPIIDHYNDKLAKKWNNWQVSKIVSKRLKDTAKQSLPQPNDTGLVPPRRDKMRGAVCDTIENQLISAENDSKARLLDAKEGALELCSTGTSISFLHKDTSCREGIAYWFIFC